MGAISIITGILKGTVGRTLITLIGQNKPGMLPTKGVLTSKTYLGLIVAGLGTLGPVFDIHLSEGQYVEIAEAAMVIIGIVLAGYGRNTATTKIGKATEAMPDPPKIDASWR